MKHPLLAVMLVYLFTFPALCDDQLSGKLKSKSPYDEDEEFIIKSQFCNAYCYVQDELLSGDGILDQVTRLVYLDRKKAESIFKFWEARAEIAVLQSLEKQGKSTISRMKTAKDESEKVKLLDDLRNAKREAYKSYYYDNWGSINKMVSAAVTKLEEERKQKLNQLSKRQQPTP